MAVGGTGSLRLMLCHVCSHEFPDHLRRRPVLPSAGFKELAPEFPIHPDSQTCILGFHGGSVTNGYTFVYKKTAYIQIVLTVWQAMAAPTRSAWPLPRRVINRKAP